MSDNNASSNKKTRKFLKWKEKKDRGRNMQNAFNNTASTHEHHDRPHYNGAIFRPPSTSKFNAVFRPQVSSFYPAAASTSQSNAALHSQVSSRCSTTQQNSKPTTSAHNLPSFAARRGPPHGHPRTFMNSKRDSPSAVAGSSGQSSGQRTSSTFTATQKSLKYLAIDCEMVGTGPKGQISQLARCSIVSYDGDVVFDKFIRPTQPVTDYRTRWSGIRSYDLIRATPYTQARKEILKLLMGKVLVGHAIHNDLKVLSYCHPKALIRDTSRIPLLNTKAGFPENQVISLKRLTKAILNRDIQTGTKGHSSVEDAKATMDLYKVVEVEYERSLASTTKTDGSLLEK